jgi:LPS sulfotransferase NodH
MNYLRYLRHRYYPYLERLATDWGLRPGNDDYTRFIILGRSRVGSNFLRGLLDSHPGIAIFGELFQNQEDLDWAHPFYLNTRRTFNLRKDQPVKFLEQQVYGAFPARIQAAGFKIFYYHAQTEPWKPVWTYLVEQTDIRVLHIKRKNLLDIHLSRKHAEQSDVWVNWQNRSQTQPDTSIRLEYQECLDDFTQTRGWEQEFDRLFAGHPVLEVVYEDLAADYVKTMECIQDFLDVHPYPVQPRTSKQAKRQRSNDIVNYSEMKERFRGTEWQAFFTDDELS